MTGFILGQWTDQVVFVTQYQISYQNTDKLEFQIPIFSIFQMCN
jgi:hypothetical protein